MTTCQYSRPTGHPERSACLTCVEERLAEVESALAELLAALAPEAADPGPAQIVTDALAASRERLAAKRAQERVL